MPRCLPIAAGPIVAVRALTPVALIEEGIYCGIAGAGAEGRLGGDKLQAAITFTLPRRGGSPRGEMLEQISGSPLQPLSCPLVFLFRLHNNRRDPFLFH